MGRDAARDILRRWAQKWEPPVKGDRELWITSVARVPEVVALEAEAHLEALESWPSMAQWESACRVSVIEVEPLEVGDWRPTEVEKEAAAQGLPAARAALAQGEK